MRKDRMMTILVFGILKTGESVMLGCLDVALSKKYVDERIGVKIKELK